MTFRRRASEAEANTWGIGREGGEEGRKPRLVGLLCLGESGQLPTLPTVGLLLALTVAQSARCGRPCAAPACFLCFPPKTMTGGPVSLVHKSRRSLQCKENVFPPTFSQKQAGCREPVRWAIGNRCRFVSHQTGRNFPGTTQFCQRHLAVLNANEARLVTCLICTQWAR